MLQSKDINKISELKNGFTPRLPTVPYFKLEYFFLITASLRVGKFKYSDQSVWSILVIIEHKVAPDHLQLFPSLFNKIRQHRHILVECPC